MSDLSGLSPGELLELTHRADPEYTRRNGGSPRSSEPRFAAGSVAASASVLECRLQPDAVAVGTAGDPAVVVSELQEDAESLEKRPRELRVDLVPEIRPTAVGLKVVEDHNPALARIRTLRSTQLFGLFRFFDLAIRASTRSLHLMTVDLPSPTLILHHLLYHTNDIIRCSVKSLGFKLISVWLPSALRPRCARSKNAHARRNSPLLPASVFPCRAAGAGRSDARPHA